MGIFSNPEDEIETVFYTFFKEVKHELSVVSNSIRKVEQDVSSLNNKLDSVVQQARGIEQTIEQKIPTIPSIPNLGNLEGITGVTELVNRVTAVSDPSTLYSIMDTVSSLSQEASQHHISELLDAVGSLVIEINRVVEENLPKAEKNIVSPMLDRVGLSITYVNHYATLFESAEGGKLLNHIHVFCDALDSITHTINGLTRDLRDVLGSNTERSNATIGMTSLIATEPDVLKSNTEGKSKTISSTIGMISLIATEANELTSLISSILPLDVGVGASGGVAAGIEGAIIGKVNVISIGPATFGTIGFIFSAISNILDYIDSFVKD